MKVEVNQTKSKRVQADKVKEANVWNMKNEKSKKTNKDDFIWNIKINARLENYKKINVIFKLILFFALFALLDCPTYTYAYYRMSLTSRVTLKD